MSEKRFTYFKVPVGFAKQAIKDNANDEVFDFTLDNVLDKLNEQQATIRKLQDLCGESDGENAKLRIENEQLKYDNTMFKQIIKNFQKVAQTDKRRLEDENEQLRRLFEEMKQPITINLTEEDEKELRKLLGLIDDE